MSVDRQKQAARSIAALDDQASIENRPLLDITADLKALGIDPKASIMAARQRSLERSSPAGRLLARLDEGDAIASEIEALESADIADVQAALPPGAAAAIAATAKRQSGRPDHPVAPERPGRRFWGWGSSMVGIAACLLLFILTRPDLLSQAERSMIEPAEEAAAIADATTADDAEFAPSFQAPPEPRTALNSETADRAERPAEPERHAEPPGVAAPNARAALEIFGAQDRKKGDVPALLEAKQAGMSAQRSNGPEPSDDRRVAKAAPAPVPEPARQSAPAVAALEAESPVALGSNQGAIQETLTGADSDLAPGIADRNSYRAILIVDPDRTPRDLKEKARTLPEGRLIERLDEARTLLSPRPVVALVTDLRAGEEIDAAVTVRRPLGDAVTPLAASAWSRAAGGDGFELVDLPRKP